MPRRRRPVLSSKKSPRQARSKDLVAAILAAAIRVLEREGAARFTTIRVAAAAGVSVGSLYQYFPNKESLLFRLQADEWARTSALIDSFLFDARRPPLERLRRAIPEFFRTEQDEAALRGALHDSGALIRDAPETHAHRTAYTRRMREFIALALPAASASTRAFAADFTMVTMSSIGERITREPLGRAELDRWATATAAMLCDYLATLA